MDNRVSEGRIAQTRAEIAKRIEPFCRGLPKAEFESLLDRMTEIRCKYDISPHLPGLAESAKLDGAMNGRLQPFKKSLGS